MDVSTRGSLKADTAPQPLDGLSDQPARRSEYQAMVDEVLKSLQGPSFEAVSPTHNVPAVPGGPSL